MGMTVMVDQTRSGLIPCAAYCKSANTVFPQSIQCNVQEKTDLCLNGRPGRYGTEKLTRSGAKRAGAGSGIALAHLPHQYTSLSTYESICGQAVKEFQPKKQN